jgi:methionine-gamma-lyase
MDHFLLDCGLSTLVNHYQEGDNPLNAHVAPIYQTVTFNYPDTVTGGAIQRGEQEGYFYTRVGGPNAHQLARKYAMLEGLDLLKEHPETAADEIVAGELFASGMAAITTAILARVHAGESIIAQQALYGATFNFLHDIAPRLGIQVIWVTDTTPRGWEQAFAAHPRAALAYAESPVNPTMLVVDLVPVAEIAHRHGAWLMVDNTFATPFCQRPLSLGADVVIHSTTKYLSGHGVVVGGAVISKHPDYIHGELHRRLELFGGVPSPFDAWLANLGLRTFELRMLRHCENALAIARHLQTHPKVATVHYPGLEVDPGHAIASRQMHAFGGMLSFELKNGLPAGAALMDAVRVATLAVSLGNVDTLIQHPASMTHTGVPPEERRRMGIQDGLVRLSVGIENAQDLIADLDQALERA